MELLGWLWLVSPFVLIAVISHDKVLQRGVANNLGQARVAGGAGVVMMFLGAVVVPGALGATMFVLGTPLVGLLAFIRRDDGDDEGGEEGPDTPPVDWDEFERSFRGHVRRGRRSPRPRSPTAA